MAYTLYRLYPGADMVLDVVLEVHRGVKTGADDLSDVGVSKEPAQHDPLNPPVRSV